MTLDQAKTRLETLISGGNVVASVADNGVLAMSWRGMKVEVIRTYQPGHDFSISDINNFVSRVKEQNEHSTA